MRGRRITGRAEFVEVGADGKDTPLASQPHVHYIGIDRSDTERVEQLVAHGSIDCIAGVGAVEG